MVYLKVPKGNEAREDTTFVHIRNRYSVLNMQYSYAKYNFFLLLSLLLYILQHVAQAAATIRNKSVHMHSLARAFR